MSLMIDQDSTIKLYTLKYYDVFQGRDTKHNINETPIVIDNLSYQEKQFTIRISDLFLVRSLLSTTIEVTTKYFTETIFLLSYSSKQVFDKQQHS